MSIKTNIKFDKFIENLDKFIENLIKDLKHKFKKKQLNISYKNLNIFNNYIKKKISTQNIDRFGLEILDKLQNKLTNKQLQRFNDIEIALDRYIELQHNKKTPFKKIIQTLKNNLPKLKVYDSSSNIKYKKTDILHQSPKFQGIYLIDKHPDKILKNISIIDGKYKKPSDLNTLNLIINEVLILEKLNDTNISPKLYEYFLSIDKNNLILSLVQEKMDMSLSNWLDNGNILNHYHKKQLNDKMQKLHDFNIIHNDINPTNILVKEIDNNIDLYIADFGFSNFFNNIIDEHKQTDNKALNNIFVSRNSSNYNNKITITLICLLNILVTM